MKVGIEAGSVIDIGAMSTIDRGFRLAAAVAFGTFAAVLPSCGARADGSSIKNTGSDTLLQVAGAWAEAYKKVDPSVGIVVNGGGSGVGVAKLLDGTTDICNASRDLKKEEIAAAKERNIDPVKHVVGYDALAVYVHKDNPIEKLTLEQLAEIYGEGGKIDKWSDLGVTIPGAKSDQMVRLSRQNTSGTYEYFKEATFGSKRDYKLGALNLHGSKEVVDTVERTPGSIGYSGLGYATEEVRVVPIVGKDGTAVAPSIDAAIDGSYPIARPLFMFTPGEPTGKVKHYLDWVVSDAGQRVLLDEGYAPLRKLK